MKRQRKQNGLLAKRRHVADSIAKGPGEQPVLSPRSTASEPCKSSHWSWRTSFVVSLVLAVFAWSYWPVCIGLMRIWESQPDYSHGWIVVPVVGYMLWARRAIMPTWPQSIAWGGMLVILLSIAVRVAGSVFYIDSVEAWSIPLWAAGVFWLLGGRNMFWWSLPAVAFLGFMIPLPFRAEQLLSYPLQRVATSTSCWILQCLAQPAVQEANVILLGDVRINIVEACSGLRIFVSILALAYLYAVLIKKPRRTKLAMFAAVVPVAVLANALRIVLTGLLHVMVSGEAAHRFSHDLAGWLMLPIAGAMLASVVWYFDKLIVEVETFTATDLLRLGLPRPSTSR